MGWQRGRATMTTVTEERHLKVGELAKAVGKTVRAMHLYEEMGLLRPVSRSAGGYRLYTLEAVARVKWISRKQDLGFTGNMIQAMLWYASAETPMFNLRDASRIIAIGSDGMMRAVKDARHGVLAPYLAEEHVGIGSINSPMQCMMKQVCAQCLQRHTDPVSGKESFVFSCFNQDQKLDEVDFINLRARLRQNTVLEKLSNLWLTRLLAKQEVASAQV